METKTITLENRLLTYYMAACSLLTLKSNSENACVVITDAHNTIFDDGTSNYHREYIYTNLLQVSLLW